MRRLFKINFAISRAEALEAIAGAISKAGTSSIGVVDGNVLATSAREASYAAYLDDSVANICDGSSISLMGRLIRGWEIQTYTGPELFRDLITARKYTSYFLGSSEGVLQSLRENLTSWDPGVAEMPFVPLEFCAVEDFKYSEIAAQIDACSPDIIWVSLGAPKQELFIQRLKPLCRRGVFIGVGAAFNFYSGLPDQVRAPGWMRRFKLEWLYRSLREKRIAKRALAYLFILPRIVFVEIIQRIRQPKEP